MSEKLEYDWPPTMRPRRRRPKIETVEILPPQEPERHVRVTVEHRHHQAPQPWIIALAIVVALMWVSPFGAVVALVVPGVLVTAHPTVAIAIGGTLALVVAIGIVQRCRGVRF